MHSDTTIVTHTRLTTITCMRTFCSVLPVGSRSRLRSYMASVMIPRSCVRVGSAASWSGELIYAAIIVILYTMASVMIARSCVRVGSAASWSGELIYAAIIVILYTTCARALQEFLN